ncbi:hypothetical protein [Streptomyces sp. NPDC002467]|uniref:hypothetical protein n=1 Tax=Streptomyces sp. NPDC002467 TaxID=3364647 RepID=UPI00368010DC
MTKLIHRVLCGAAVAGFACLGGASTAHAVPIDNDNSLSSTFSDVTESVAKVPVLGVAGRVLTDVVGKPSCDESVLERSLDVIRSAYNPKLAEDLVESQCKLPANSDPSDSDDTPEPGDTPPVLILP